MMKLQERLKMTTTKLQERLAAESKLPMFSTVDANDKLIDMKATFQPVFPPFFVRVAMLIIILALLFLDAFGILFSLGSDDEYYDSSFQSFTFCSYIVSAIYFILSLVLSQSPYSFHVQEQRQEHQQEHQQQRQNASTSTSASQTPVSKLTKITWATFVININLQLFSCIVILVLTAGGDLSRSLRHLILFILVGVDGFVVKRIPIRLKQIAFGCIATVGCLIYIFVVDIVVELVDEPPEIFLFFFFLGLLQFASFAACMLVAVFFVTFGLSALVPRRYVVQEEAEEECSVTEEVEAPIYFPVAVPLPANNLC